MKRRDWYSELGASGQCRARTRTVRHNAQNAQLEHEEKIVKRSICMMFSGFRRKIEDISSDVLDISTPRAKRFLDLWRSVDRDSELGCDWSDISA